MGKNEDQGNSPGFYFSNLAFLAVGPHMDSGCSRLSTSWWSWAAVTTQVAWLVQITARGEFVGIYCFYGKNSMEPYEFMELSMGSSWDILTQ